MITYIGLTILGVTWCVAGGIGFINETLTALHAKRDSNVVFQVIFLIVGICILIFTNKFVVI